ncbi:MAG: hypothetical protein ABSH06_07215 [Thermodesulfobacteriota bacterium]
MSGLKRAERSASMRSIFFLTEGVSLSLDIQNSPFQYSIHPMLSKAPAGLIGWMVKKD